jgi:hypothetical protein
VLGTFLLKCKTNAEDGMEVSGEPGSGFVFVKLLLDGNKTEYVRIEVEQLTSALVAFHKRL